MSNGQGAEKAAREYPRGPRSMRWNDGSYIHSKGYVYVYVGVTHPLADSKGYVALHTMVWVSAGNPRPRMRDGVLLHHKDEYKNHNAYENLELKTFSRHAIEHNKAARIEAGFDEPDEIEHDPGMTLQEIDGLPY